jgi:exosortase/archaeosortase
VKPGRFRGRTGPAPTKLPGLGREFLCRVGLVAVFAAAAHQFQWEWLRFLTSECVLRISASLGMAASRASFDTIQVGRQAFQFVIACTFVDVFMGSIPLLWDLKKSVPRNILWLIAAAAVLFGFNVVRLEVAQLLYDRGVSWTVADEVLGGFAYFAVWLAIWRLRSWKVWTPLTEPHALPARS